MGDTNKVKPSITISIKLVLLCRFSPAPTDPSSPPSSTLYTYKYPEKGSKFSFSIMRYTTLFKLLLLFCIIEMEMTVVLHFLMPQTVSPTVISVIATPPFIIVQFFDQYLTLNTKLPAVNNIYGLGEHVTPYLKLQPRTYTLWAYDTPTPQYLNLCEYQL